VKRLLFDLVEAFFGRIFYGRLYLCRASYVSSPMNSSLLEDRGRLGVALLWDSRVSPVPLVCVLVALVQASGGYPLCAAFKKPRLQLAMITMRVAKQEKYVAIGKRLQRCASASVRQWTQRRR
jgi:hypothetical protein